MSRSSIDPNKTWAALLEFETRDLILRAFKTRHGRELSVEQVREIATSFAQGRAYFSAAQTAAMSVKPVLLFYGVQALTVGLVLFLTRKPSAARIKPSHGLETMQWRETLSVGLTAIDGLTVAVREGVFLELITATENAGYFRANSSAINWKYATDAPPLGFQFTFDDLVRKVPDVLPAYHTWRQTKIAVGVVQSVNVNPANEAIIMEFGSRLSDEALHDLFPQSLFGDVADSGSSGSRVGVPTTSEPFFAQLTEGAFGIGDLAVVPPFSAGHYLSPLAVHYAGSYFIGMLARYFPAQWVSLERLAKGDSARPVIVRLLDLIERTYPDMVLAFLKGPYPFEAPRTGGLLEAD